MEPQFKKYLILIIVLLIVVAVAGFGVFVYQNGWSALGINKPQTDDTDKTPDNVQGTRFEKLNATGQLDALRLQYPPPVPKIDKEEPATASVLPQEVLDLLTGSTITKVWSVVYSPGSIGFEIEFDMAAKSGDEAFHTFVKSLTRSVWDISSGYYSDKAALLNLDSKTYIAALSFAQTTPELTLVKVLMVKK